MSDERSKFLKKIKKQASKMAENAKKDAPRGYLEDDEILEKLGIEDTENRIVVTAKLSRIGYGLSKDDIPYVNSRFTITEGEYRGMPIPGRLFYLDDSNKNYDMTVEQMFYFFQSCGIETHDWEKSEVHEKLADAADELTSKKPVVTLSIGAWERQDKSLGLSVYVNALVQEASQSTATPTPDEPEEQEEDQYEDADTAEEPEEEEEQEASASSNGDVDVSEWVGYQAKYTFAGDPEAYWVEITKYDKRNGKITFTCDDQEYSDDDVTAFEFVEE